MTDVAKNYAKGEGVVYVPSKEAGRHVMDIKTY